MNILSKNQWVKFFFNNKMYYAQLVHEDVVLKPTRVKKIIKSVPPENVQEIDLIRNSLAVSGPLHVNSNNEEVIDFGLFAVLNNDAGLLKIRRKNIKKCTPGKKRFKRIPLKALMDLRQVGFKETLPKGFESLGRNFRLRLFPTPTTTPI